MSAGHHPSPDRRVTIHDRQARVPVATAELERWRAVGEAALALIGSERLARAEGPARVGVIIVDDAAIADLHGRFLEDPTPTDVLTFPLGEEAEIVISIETAQRQAREFGSSTGHETCLYIVHGLLHLHGYEDASDAGRAEMARRQEWLLDRARQEGPPTTTIEGNSVD